MVFVTTTAVNRTPVFDSQSICDTVIIQLEETAKYCEVSLIGYVLMSSHLHALLGLPKIELLSKFMQSFKSLTSRKLKKYEFGKFKDKLWKKDRFRLWRPRFDDVIITSGKQFKIKLEYIHNNPVMAGLVNDPSGWLYSSAGDWLGESKGMLQVDKYFKWVK